MTFAYDYDLCLNDTSKTYGLDINTSETELMIRVKTKLSKEYIRGINLYKADKN